jgi:hypothetical protein
MFVGSAELEKPVLKRDVSLRRHAFGSHADGGNGHELGDPFAIPIYFKR